MSTLLQTADGDLDIAGHTLRLVTAPDVEVAQKLAGRFRLFLGEWAFDPLAGVPYFERILGTKGATLAAVETLIQRIATECPGVAAVESLTTEQDATLRLTTFKLRVRAQTGALLVGQVGGLFRVEEG